jgi:hypothetical protein
MWNEPTPEQLDKLPRLYETENVPLKDKQIHLHFFLAGCEWFIAVRVRGVAVGTLVAQRPPHRSVREELPHTALALGNNAKADQRIRMTNTDKREPPVHETFHPIPNQAMFVAPASQYLKPQSTDLLPESRQRGAVHRDTIVANVPSHDRP